MDTTRDTRTKHFEFVQVYPGFDRQKFWNLFADYEGWSGSDILAGEISIVEPGQDHSMGNGAVRSVLSGSMTITEDITGFQPPVCFAMPAATRYQPESGYLIQSGKYPR